MSGAHIAAHIAAEKNRKEEETMTNYRPEDLSGDWEFKILRSASGAFGKPAVQAQAEAEEAQAGWTLLEKFDNDRLRFKRPVSARRKDEMLPPGVDPYRTIYGIGEGLMAFWVISAIVLAFGLLAWVGSMF
ncbi:MAG: hypothetical protein EPO32_08025 [Anaerolineae bacterium]|nr:MAG: hypothetical protein EPO32_08025 [Anaerolineae bacterium]